MQLAVETPTNCIQQFSPLTDYDFVEAHYCTISPEYNEAYRWNDPEEKRPRPLILDNSAFLLGRAMDIGTFGEVVKSVHPTMIVLPDVLGNTGETLALSHKWIMKFIDRYEVMGVLQGNSMAEFDYCAEMYQRWGVELIGIPYHSIDRGLWLETRADQLKPGTGIHILGLKNPFDVLLYGKFPQVQSIDTSLPVGSGCKELLFSTGQFASGRFDPTLIMTGKQMEVTIQNIKFLSQLCKGKL